MDYASANVGNLLTCRYEVYLFNTNAMSAWE